MGNSAILCIDDEMIVLDTLSEQLSYAFGDEFIIESAENAQDGFAIIEELVEKNITVLLVVSDWLMPGMKGDEFLIKVHKQFPNIIKIMLTGQANEEAIENAKNFGNIYSCVSKPWNEKELLKIIRDGLSHHE